MHSENPDRPFTLNRKLAWGIWVAFLFLISWFDKTTTPLPYVGDAALVLLSLSLGSYGILLVFQRGSLPKPMIITEIFIGLLILVYIFGQVFSSIGSIKTIAQLFLLGLFFLGGIFILPAEKTIKVVAALFVFLSLINLLLWAAKRFAYPFEGIFYHKNILGGMIVYGLFFILAAFSLSKSKHWFWKAGFIIGLIVLLASGSRTAWLTIAVVVVAYFLWPKVVQRPGRYSLLFLLVFVGSAGIMFAYVAMSHMSFFPQIEGLVYRLTHQNLYSGRQVIWPYLIDVILRKPWGYGPGAIPEYFLPIALSSHNLYLQVALQAGFIALFILGAILYSIWVYLSSIPHDMIVRLAGSFLLATLVHQAFEVDLTQTNLTIGIVIWSILAIGAGRVWLIDQKNRVSDHAYRPTDP